MATNGPVEPSADMREGAYHVRQLFIALTAEGFTEQQALVIVGQVIRAGSGGNNA